MKKKLQKTILIISALLLFFSGSLFGQNTYAFDVDGNKMFNVSDHADLDVTGDFTIEAWIQFNNFNGRLCDRTGVLKIYATSNSIRFDNDDGVTGSISTGDISSDAGDNSWHHIAVSRENASSTTRIFYDGVEKASFDIAISASDQAFSIGGQDGWYGNWDARIDEFRFSNSTRYTANFTPPSEPLADDANTILLFHFDDNTQIPPENDGANFGPFTSDNGKASTAGYEMDATDYVVATGLPLPVELTKFVANINSDNIVLEWSTATEVNNYGFEIERAIADNFETIGFVEGAGNSNSPKNYSFVDVAVSGEVSYRLKQIDTDGSFEYSNVVTVKANGLAKTELFQNHPNPFNPTTQISFTISELQNVKLVVYNALGQQVAELINGEINAGTHTANFDGSNLTSGFYVYRLETPKYSKTMKMMLIK